MQNANDNIPQQTEGKQTDTIHFVDCASQPDAHHLFLLAKEKLRNVSMWHKFAGPHSARFAITDTAGNETYKTADKGDLFYIDLPAPGPAAGDGKEWVRIEAIDIEENAEAESEYITMTVRPVASPTHTDAAPVAHFFSHASTSTFIVERYLNHVSAAVHGRNEVPNNEGVGLYDTVRNTVIALLAREGLSLVQWTSLVKGLLER